MVTTPAVLLLDQPTISGIADLDALIVSIESAFAAHATGRSLAPQLSHVEADGGEFHIKSGGLRVGEKTYFACKVGGGVFNNRSQLGLPNIIGLIILCDGTNGAPLAVMDSTVLTRLRTGAATAVAAKYLARPDSRSALICGAGMQAEIQLRALLRVLPIERALIWARGDSRLLAERLSCELQIDVGSSTDLKSAALNSDVIITCTPSRRWFLDIDHVARGTFIAAIGADSPGKQELASELLSRHSVVFDLVEQCAHVGELQHAISTGLMTRERVRGELGEVITGRVSRRQSSDEIIIFDSTGTALQDVAAAALLYERARLEGAGQVFRFWP